MTTNLSHRSLLILGLVLTAAVEAQGPDLLLTYSQPERTLSNSAGTPMRFLYPNEIAHLEYSNGPCSSLSAEKWSPRTCFQTQAGDENSDAMYWNPTLFGSIDALVAGISTSPIAGGANPRTIFYSVSTAMGTGVSGSPQLRPGDVGHIVRNGSGDGQVEYFISQEQIDNALGLPLTTAIDVDAAAFSPSYGVFLSLDQDITIFTGCGPLLLRDGDVFCIPPYALTYTWDYRIATTTPGSAVVVYTEAQMDAMVANAGVTDRFGACITTAVDTEALEIDWSGPVQTIVPCAGIVVQVPTLLFATETMTGASVLTTAGGGTIYSNMCNTMGTACGSGPTFGPQSGIQPTSTAVGAPSHVNALCSTYSLRYSMEARNPVLNSSPNGLPAGASMFDISSPAPLNFIFVTFAPSGVNAVPSSFPGFPWSLFGYPDYYPTNFYYNWYPTVGGFCTFPSFAVPPNFPVKLLFQSVGVVNGNIEFSTPAMLDIL